MFQGLSLDQRGISVVVSSLIVMSALFGFTTFVLVHKARQGQRRAEGLIDTMRDAEKRQSQLIDFSYAENQGSDLHVYLSNYGWENAVIEKVWIDGNSVSEGNWRVKLAGSGNTTSGKNTLPKREFVYVEGDGKAGGDVFAFLTESNSVYKWRVS